LSALQFSRNPGTPEAARHDRQLADRAFPAPGAGARLGRLGTRSASRARFTPLPLCAELESCSLHAAVHIPGHDRERLEHLCRGSPSGRPTGSSRCRCSAPGLTGATARRTWCASSSYSSSVSRPSCPRRVCSCKPTTACSRRVLRGVTSWCPRSLGPVPATKMLRPLNKNPESPRDRRTGTCGPS